MSKDNKIKYETDTPVQGEMREHAISALDKFIPQYQIHHLDVLILY